MANEYLDALLFCDGRQGFSSGSCEECCDTNVQAIYRCQQCFNGGLLCQNCCVNHHHHLPLHQIETWDSGCFEHTTLFELGLVVQLGHGNCPSPNLKKGASSFTVIHINGLHKVLIYFCDCSTAPHAHIQLLHSGWFPVTVVLPQTCATFNILRHFHLLSLQSKLSAHQFYCALKRGTNNTGLLNLQCGGCAHDPSGTDGMKPGKLAITCPACPDPDINLPPNWEKSPQELQYLYTYFQANDANFHLKNCLNTVIDVDLGTRWSYFQGAQTEMSTCSGLAAIDHANTKNSKGLHITGVGASICTHHGFLHPLGIGNLQKGECFSNMDYIIFSTLRGYSPPSLALSYDLICQYWTKIRQCMPWLPPELWVDLDKLSVKLFLPKLHALAHKSECSVLYSLNFTPGVGCTDGEGIEWEWAEINIAANSTKEMSEGACHDTLDDLLSDKNFWKEIGLGKSLLMKLKTTQVESAKHVEQFKSFTGGLDPATV
ncbi:hypothetical protein BS47DRAFT_1374507 [Hydnum rufescens UP504]|uniref:CxC2-like cysteine cluster KDZ transposase-associated domain-containing protein n=1 Tax=Hydnum rufescens UP504 TaxID=1448309 RepID=A0A9P6AC56_9AGAM|nr:hypothetical protein BS47DRAFT_1374507 [Hydnum rufescens UP504]